MKSGGHLKGLQGMGSVFGVATRIEGTVRIEESVRIDGKIEGNLDQPDGNARWIVIGPKGEVHGDIRAQNVSVAGKVFGNITASESIELLEGSAVRGNIAHKSINVEPGATLHGQLIGGESAPVEPAANQDEGPEATA